VHSSGEILINKLPENTVVLVETEDAIYELTVLVPSQNVVGVNTNDRRFLEIPNVTINTPIAWGDCMRMVTNESVLFSRKANGATVRGKGFNYDVF